MFELSSVAQELLQAIVDNGNPTEMLKDMFYVRLEKEQRELKSILDELLKKRYIRIDWGWSEMLDDGIGLFEGFTPESVEIFETAKTYLEQQKNDLLMGEAKEYDVFISYASKDKCEYVEGLSVALKKLGITIFYDSDVISWGDNWKQVILDGTEKSEFAIIVISDSFFGREWTERELAEFLRRQNENNQKIVLPLLHGITFDQLVKHYPELKYIQGKKSEDYTYEGIAVLLAKELIKRYKS